MITHVEFPPVSGSSPQLFPWLQHSCPRHWHGRSPFSLSASLQMFPLLMRLFWPPNNKLSTCFPSHFHFPFQPLTPPQLLHFPHSSVSPCDTLQLVVPQYLGKIDAWTLLIFKSKDTQVPYTKCIASAKLTQVLSYTRNIHFVHTG